MNKNAVYTFNGINQDASKSKHPFEFYFDAEHIKITATDSQTESAVTNEKGTELVVTIPTVTIDTNANTISYNNKVKTYTNSNEIDTQVASGSLPATINSRIVGNALTRTGAILFTTDNNGGDCIWLISNIVDGSYDLELLYVRSLGFSFDNPIQAIFNYENKNIQKVYWVDGLHQIRFINITHDNIQGNDRLIDTNSDSLNFVGKVDFSQPKITDIVQGGIHTSGMIQYAYNLFKLNSSQTKISPLSNLIPLGKGDNLGGGEINEQVSATPIINIENIDTSYDFIRIYAIKYTSKDEIPSINLIEEREINNLGSIVVYDDGNTISSLTLEEFLFLGSDPVTPQHITTKDSRLFLSNIQTKSFLLPDELDTRAYSFDMYGSITSIYNNIYKDDAGIIKGDSYPVNSSNFNAPSKHDSINLDYDNVKYLPNDDVLGAEGKYIKLEIVQKNLTNPENYKVLKDRELYRFGIEFFNRLGQVSLPKWICDYKMPTGNLEGNYNTVKVSLKSEFYTWLDNYSFQSEDDRPVGYRILRANRTINDRTIVCQGVLGSMMVNTPRNSDHDKLYSLSEKREDSKIQPKLPNFLLRTFNEIVPLKATNHLEGMQFYGPGARGTGNTLNEIQYDDSERKADTYQYSAMYQMYSPEIMFDNINIGSVNKFNVVGGLENNYNAWWGQNRNVSTKSIEGEGKAFDKLTYAAPGGNSIQIKGNINEILGDGLISDGNDNKADVRITFNQFYREFKNFIPGYINQYNIYGSPEITERGQGRTTYNNNSKYEYRNSLEGFLTDGQDNFKDDGSLTRAIISLNSYCAKCITMVGDKGDNENVEPHTRPLLETIYYNSNINNLNTILLAELVKNEDELYLGGLYNGNSFEDKKRTSYIQIGDYSHISEPSVQIDNAGDTFVQEYRFMRVGKTDTEIYSVGVNQHTEIVVVKVETTIDLKNRNDISFSEWDSRFQPRDDEYHQYNNVYSQEPDLTSTTDLEGTFRRIESFDTRIQSTKLKTPNESIDSWTDILANETMHLDGKYGPINALSSYKDNVFAFQDEAIASISINPRVQVQGSDNIGIELGTGGILYDYNYLTTNSGSNNKWGITVGKRGIYYYDILNKGIGRIPDSTEMLLSDTKGLHTYFNNTYDYDSLNKDNPILDTGVVFGTDLYNDDIYFTFLQGDKSFTRVYNEARDQFIDLKHYKPQRYINKGSKLIGVDNDGVSLHEHYAGEYNNYYGNVQSSKIVIQMNPERFKDTVFNNIMYNSEAYLDEQDLPEVTLTHIRAYSEYQDSGRIPLVIGRKSNIRRKFREWKANIPREGRNRIRNPWIYLVLEFENTSNYRFVLHDVILDYTI